MLIRASRNGFYGVVVAVTLLVGCQASVGVDQLVLVSPKDGSTVAVGSAACAGVDGPDSDTDPDLVTLQFAWAPVGNAESYRVEVRNANGAVVATMDVTATTAQTSWLTDASRPCPGTYTWRVTATRTPPHVPVESASWSFSINQ